MIQNRYTVAGDIEVIADLQLNGQPVLINTPSCTVEARIAEKGKATLAAGTSAVTCEKDAQVSNRVIARFPHTMTGQIVPGIYEVELVLTEGSKVYPWERIEIIVDPRAAP